MQEQREKYSFEKYLFYVKATDLDVQSDREEFQRVIDLKLGDRVDNFSEMTYRRQENVYKRIEKEQFMGT